MVKNTIVHLQDIYFKEFNNLPKTRKSKSELLEKIELSTPWLSNNSIKLKIIQHNGNHAQIHNSVKLCIHSSKTTKLEIKKHCQSLIDRIIIKKKKNQSTANLLNEVIKFRNYYYYSKATNIIIKSNHITKPEKNIILRTQLCPHLISLCEIQSIVKILYNINVDLEYKETNSHIENLNNNLNKIAIINITEPSKKNTTKATYNKLASISLLRKNYDDYIKYRLKETKTKTINELENYIYNKIQSTMSIPFKKFEFDKIENINNKSIAIIGPANSSDITIENSSFDIVYTFNNQPIKILPGILIRHISPSFCSQIENEQEKLPEADIYTFSNRLMKNFKASNATLLYSPHKLPFNTVLSAVQRVVFDLYNRNSKSIYVTGTTLFLKNNNRLYYDKKYEDTSQSNYFFNTGILCHDPIVNFIFLKIANDNKIITVDQQLQEILSYTLEEYLYELFNRRNREV